MTGQELKDAMKALGWSNIQLSRVSGYSELSVSRMRNDKMPVSPQMQRIVQQARELKQLKEGK
ncbi:hypothetical protein [uncultured Pseudomonas sp.]|uniref:hypothetical protein n=1 Tax=uncultured Pseudomonas sp. TaxID=114707 RepID=UPI0025F9E8A0|nr:hypothetical protein [uncultured Pseudomonas sp.]